ncbi:MAG: sigma 54-interacting transcriptional regulator [Deltaproteobacteria bacterium]|nr:sigma 54-interacting transcriptional regulator [Deltaproteobacteria bacterium]
MSTDRSEETAHLEEPSIRLVSLKEGGRLTTESLQLQITEPSGKKQTLLMKRSPFRIGKGSHNDVILADQYVSDQHCKIRLSDGDWILKDLASTNGTFLAGKKVQETALTDGQQIRLGKTEIVFKTVKTEERIAPDLDEKFAGLVGKSQKMRELFAMIRRVAPSAATILIQGETGTGKELIARAIHQHSLAIKGPFIAINCGAISSELIESELFGHEKGAFTGAANRHHGAFETAGNGTLFLDEIGELPLKLQPKLLRVLEQKAVKRVGGQQEFPVSCRIVTATHRNLKDEVKKGSFREDLFFRLHIIPLTVLPLRERREDIPTLVRHFLDEQGKNSLQLSAAAEKGLIEYDWPGNVRELRNSLTRAVLLTKGREIQLEDLQFMEDSSNHGDSPDPSLRSAERDVILNKLKETGWNKTRAAEELGIAKSTLFKKIKEYGLKP